ncbi:hypothetical protein SAMN04515671_4459 [Nakamurella panacisegetis]|uniref:Deazaflavin-dependent oxidoreductase, nitroreductase family n=1 Tax=Nakamurella panacisegetis TaxID=1090615 RepID=A0A1H0T531_9ACTN|nr:hypothetical protein [Nakamurella panacisegetis]SDP48860.1 hypothetical protein SAMN04515671_4459 [Nakamurella panacisegetis]
MSTAVDRRVPPQRLINAINPVVRGLLRSPLHGLLDRSVLVLHLRGRKTGRRYDIPVSYIDFDGRLMVTTQHRWRINARGRTDIEVTHRGRRRTMRASLDEDCRSVATNLHRVIERIGWKAARRQLGLQITVGRTPTVAELETAVREFDLATLTLSES